MKWIMFPVVMALAPLLSAAEPEAVEWKSAEGAVVRYRWLEPAKVEPGKTYPLVLFLHGAGERGDDNKAQLRHGFAAIAEGAKALGEPCYLMAPQCPSELWWAPIDHQTKRLAKDQPNPLLESVVARIEQLAQRHPIDRTRLYVTGLSMGGFGTWDLLGRMPGKFAAAVPICGGGDPAKAAVFKDTPIWVFHGDKDNVVPVQTSREMVEALKKAGGAPKATWYPEAGHDSWTETYQNPELYRWLFAQKLTPGPAK